MRSPCLHAPSVLFVPVSGRVCGVFLLFSEACRSHSLQKRRLGAGRGIHPPQALQVFPSTTAFQIRDSGGAIKNCKAESVPWYRERPSRGAGADSGAEGPGGPAVLGEGRTAFELPTCPPTTSARRITLEALLLLLISESMVSAKVLPGPPASAPVGEAAGLGLGLLESGCDQSPVNATAAGSAYPTRSACL